MCLVFIVEKLGPVFHVTLALNGITTGALLGLFSMGMFFRKANTKVTIYSTIILYFLISKWKFQGSFVWCSCLCRSSYFHGSGIFQCNKQVKFTITNRRM